MQTHNTQKNTNTYKAYVNFEKATRIYLPY